MSVQSDPDATNVATAGMAVRPAGSATNHHDEASIPQLLRSLTDQGAHLATQQVALVKAEIGEAIDDLKVGLTAMIGAAVVGIAALGVFLMALGHLLGEAIESDGFGLLIVSIIALIIAYVMYSSATKKLNATNLTPERTQHTLERTPDAAAGNL